MASGRVPNTLSILIVIEADPLLIQADDGPIPGPFCLPWKPRNGLFRRKHGESTGYGGRADAAEVTLPRFHRRPGSSSC